jgi:phenylalanine-4-hydroxylase
VALASGLRLRGFAVGGGEVLQLEGALAGRPLDLPPWGLVLLSRALPSVAGGPADPAAWDRWFGALSSFGAGEGEARARARKAAALPPGLAALYAELRGVRERGEATRERLLAIREAAEAFRDDWLLRAEVDELLSPPSTHEAARAGP